MAGEADKPYKVTIPRSVHRAIRHLPVVVAHITAVAKAGAHLAGPNYTVIVQNEASTSRPRAYIAPLNAKAAAVDEAQNSTLLKVASQLRGQQ